MRQEQGDLFTYPSDAIVIPVNWTTKKNGEAVMGAGVAKQAAERWPWIPNRLGEVIRYAGGVQLRTFPTFDVNPETQWIVTFPTKGDWRRSSDLALIEGLLPSLLRFTDLNHWGTVALPRLGCGLGGLRWEDVEPVLERHLDDRFVVMTPAGEGR